MFLLTDVNEIMQVPANYDPVRKVYQYVVATGETEYIDFDNQPIPRLFFTRYSTMDFPRAHPLAEYFPESGEFDPAQNDVQRDETGRIPDTTGIFKQLDKRCNKLYKINPNNPIFAREPNWTTDRYGLDVTPQYNYEITDHQCPNCDPYGNYSSIEFQMAEQSVKSDINPLGCIETRGTNTFETRVRDNRSITIVCETEGNLSHFTFLNVDAKSKRFFDSFQLNLCVYSFERQKRTHTTCSKHITNHITVFGLSSVRTDRY